MRTAALLLIIALRLVYQPSLAQQGYAPFTSHPPETAVKSQPLRLLSIEGTIKKNKVILEWVVSENESADQFEVEKSTDGVYFRTAAYVFGTDKPETGHYRFSEKAISKKIMYRVKLVSKNSQTVYSPVVTVLSGT